MKRIIRRPAVEDMTGLKRSEIYDRIKAGTFPRQVPLGGNAVGWLEHEIDAWIEQQAAKPLPSKAPIPRKGCKRGGAANASAA